MKGIYALLLAYGKIADLLTTFIGISRGGYEMNSVALTPMAIIPFIIIFPLFLYIFELKTNYGKYMRMFIILELIVWAPVFWNIYVILR